MESSILQFYFSTDFASHLYRKQLCLMTTNYSYLAKYILKETIQISLKMALKNACLIHFGA